MGYIKTLSKIFGKTFFFKNFFFKYDIIVFDDIMPSSLSPWRSYEFENLCIFFSKVKILTDLRTFIKYNNGLSYKKNKSILRVNYPKLSQRVNKISRINNINSKLIYFIFFNNVNRYYKIAEKNNIDFVFTLYPGGGFQLNFPDCEERLKTIFRSKNFKGVFVNQNHVKEYLINSKLCEKDKIKLIPGVPVNFETKPKKIDEKKYFDSLNVLFFGNKYTERGEDKGFDTFVETANIIVNELSQITFHVIGGFNEDDLKHERLSKYFKFHGILDEVKYSKILMKTQIIVSPNKPFVINKYAFDGFPLATCVEASIYGNLILASDYFNESSKMGFEDSKDFIKINSIPENIATQILTLNNDRNLLKEISLSGKEKLSKVYSFENQIQPRINFFKTILQ